jgi:hypothetical protein
MPAPKDPIKYAEFCRKISESNKGERNHFFGKTHSEESRNKNSQSHKGKPAWNKGKRMSEDARKKQIEILKNIPPPSTDTRKKMSVAHMGKPCPENVREKLSKAMRGKRHSEESKNKMRELNKGKHLSEETRKKISESNKGRIHSEVSRKKLSKTNKRLYLDKQWYGSVKYFDGPQYCEKWNENLRERVRLFFDRRCVVCGKPEGENKLCVHHVNYNKNMCCDDSPRVLIPLCSSCHSKTNYNREYWKTYFTNMVNEIYGGRCYLTKEEFNAIF